MPRIRLIKIAPQDTADKFVIEADGIVADDSGARCRDFLREKAGKFAFGDAVGAGLLRGNASDHDGVRTRQGVVRKLNEEVDWLTNNIEIKVGANASKLHNPVGAGVEAGSFEIVEEKGFTHRIIITYWGMEKPADEDGGLPPVFLVCIAFFVLRVVWFRTLKLQRA